MKICQTPKWTFETNEKISRPFRRKISELFLESFSIMQLTLSKLEMSNLHDYIAQHHRSIN